MSVTGSGDGVFDVKDSPSLHHPCLIVPVSTACGSHWQVTSRPPTSRNTIRPKANHKSSYSTLIKPSRHLLDANFQLGVDTNIKLKGTGLIGESTRNATKNVDSNINFNVPSPITQYHNTGQKGTITCINFVVL